MEPITVFRKEVGRYWAMGTKAFRKGRPARLYGMRAVHAAVHASAAGRRAGGRRMALARRLRPVRRRPDRGLSAGRKGKAAQMILCATCCFSEKRMIIPVF